MQCLAWVFFMQVRLPFFVLHGEADTVTDPEVSRALYERASSIDKTIKLYPGMWHGLTSGEPDENIEIVFRDIIDWLDKRSIDSGDLAAQPVHHPLGPSIECPTIMTSSTERRKQQRYGNYLCGWKGRRMHHHSAMWLHTLGAVIFWFSVKLCIEFSTRFSCLKREKGVMKYEERME